MYVFLGILVQHSLLIAELALVLFAVRMSRMEPGRGARLFERAEAWGRSLARRPALSLIAIALAALAARAVLAPVLPLRQPRVTDEFSYLLAADTFASGRLSNPPHPMWQHFESMHIFQQPTYASMYQPAQGLVLAAGQRLAGHPWAGVYLSAGVMCAAICWMLQGWLPAPWALLGGTLVVVRIALFSYWMNSYWGGAVAATGGALVLGALPRFMRRLRASDALLMGVGAAILAASRPYEGGLTCLGTGAVLLTWMFGKHGPPLRMALTRFFAPMLLVLTFAAGALGFYFYRVTGSPLKYPEQVQRVPYAMAPIFLWESPGAKPVYRHKPMADFYAGWEMEIVPELSSLPGLLWNAAKKLISGWLFFLGPALTVPLFFFPSIVRDKRTRMLLLAGIVPLAGMGIDAWFYAHYAAPVTALIFAIVVQGLRHLRVWRRSSGQGLFLARAVPAVCLAMVVVRVAAQPATIFLPGDQPATMFNTSAGNTARARTLAQLSALDGLQLVIVRYGSKHRSVMNEWVYNRADIDHAKVVWARDMDAAKNRELLEYFRGRRAWLVEADETPPRLTPYPSGDLAQFSGF